MSQQTGAMRRLGPILLSPGVSSGQIWIFLVVITVTWLLFAFVAIIQPYLFSELMHIPIAQQGRLTGTLNMAQYAAVAVTILGAGSLSDRVGRKPVLIAAMIGFVITIATLSITTAVFSLVLLRMFLGVASTGHVTGGATMMVDYPENASRGKFISLMLFVQSVATAILAGWLLPHLPGWLIGHGFSGTLATRLCLWSLAAIGVVGILVAVFALKPPPRHAPPAARGDALKTLVASGRAVLAQSRADPAFGLVVLIGFVIRSDYFVSLSFLSVWVLDAARLRGLDAPTALRTVGTLQVILYLVLAVAPFGLGVLADRMSRTTMLIVALVFAAGAFGSTLLVHDVTGTGMMAVVALIGVAETGLTVASQAAFGELTPPSIRGSAMGFFVLAGTVSVIVVSGVAGLLFDRVGFTAPFLFLALLNLVFAAAAVVMVLRRPSRAASQIVDLGAGT